MRHAALLLLLLLAACEATDSAAISDLVLQGRGFAPMGTASSPVYVAPATIR